MSTEHVSPFGQRLRRLRESAGLTQEELAFRAGLTPTAVSDLERGKTRRPYPHTVRSLADALALSEEERAAFLAAVPGRGETSATAEAPVGVPEAALPSPPTPLLGRERELEEITGFLVSRSEARLVTLTGIGGVGKTRLAVEAARASLAGGGFPDGVALVALAPLRDPALVVPTLARSLGLREEQGQSTADTLRAHLREKRMLLVLDNFEHLLGAAAEVLRLVEACPGLVVLATSRAPLRVRGEQEYPVPPLALPSSTQDTAEEVAGTPSGRLFVERARAASPRFGVTSENAGAVAAICWRLAGLPLALELAAAKARFLEPQALLDRLDRALSTAWARDLPERQRTMSTTLDWSHELLSESERKLFRRLSAFAGGFTLEAAEAVGTDEGPEGPEGVLGLLGALVEQSLVMMQQPVEGGEARYEMLELVRQYALERSEESGESEGARRRHAAFFLALAERARGELRGPAQVGWLESLERENANLRAAMSWALPKDGTGERAEVAARLGWALWVFWWLRGHQEEGRRWMETLLERDLTPGVRARAVQVANSMAYTQGDYEACARYSREALELSRRAGDGLCEAYALCGLGLDAMGRGDFGEATARFEGAIKLFVRNGEEGAVPILRVWTGTVLLLQGQRDRAVAAFKEGLSLARQRGDRLGTYNALYNLAQLAMSRGDGELAANMFEEGVALSQQMGDLANLAYFLEGLAVVIWTRGEAERSAALSGASERLLEEAGAPVYNYYIPEPSLRERAAAEASASLGDAAFEEALERGRQMSFEQAVAYALLEADAPERPRPQAGDV